MSEVIDIVIPVYNEGENIVSTLRALEKDITFPFRVLICYDFEEDTTLAALSTEADLNLNVVYVLNEGKGALGAVVTGFRKSDAPAVLVLPADDDYNALTINEMVREFKTGSEIVCASRFMKGGCMRGCPIFKASLVRLASWILFWFAGLPTRDATNGFRLFSAKVLRENEIESEVGFAFSLELLAKAYRLKWKITEVPALWYEREKGVSRFQVVSWIPQYMRWFRHIFKTSFIRRFSHEDS